MYVRFQMTGQGDLKYTTTLLGVPLFTKLHILSFTAPNISPERVKHPVLCITTKPIPQPPTPSTNKLQILISKLNFY